MAEIGRWVTQHEGIFDELQEALLAATGAAGQVLRARDSGADEGARDAARVKAAAGAEDFLAVVSRAYDLPPIPDGESGTQFRSALAHWADGAEKLRDAARQRDDDRIEPAAVIIEEGNRSIYRSAAALRRATGQAPDPNNPLS